MTHDNDQPDPSPSRPEGNGHGNGNDAAEQALDAAIRSARREPSAEDAAAAKQRAWARLLEVAAQPAPAGCNDIMGELPALLAGQLNDTRADLLEDHCRECLSCRRELLRLRDAGSPREAVPSSPARRSWFRLVAPLAIAATVVLGALLTFKVIRNVGHDAPMRIARLDGQIFLADDSVTTLTEGATVPPGLAVRTTKGSRAVLELPDGSRVEMNERAELSFSPDGDALTVDLKRGDIIFEAAKRHERNLYVRTDDCRVAVKGTVFTVGHGLKGSRVGVLEGEVHVEQGRNRRVLKPGDQATTNPELGDESLEQQVQWSLSNTQWAALAHEVDSAAAQLEQEAIPPAIRYESRILDAMPAQAVFYAALPNGGSVARFTELVSERLSANPELASWWKSRQGTTTADGPSIADLLEHLGRLSSSVGNEVIVSMIIPPGEPGAHPVPVPVPVLVAAVPDEARFRDAVAALPGHGTAHASFKTLAELQKALLANTHEFVLVLHAGHVLAGPASTALLQVAAGLDSPAKVPTAFLDSLHAQYDKGAEFVLAADLSALVDRSLAEHAAQSEPGASDPFAACMGAVGLDGVERFIVTAGQHDEGSATLTFRDARSGMASWLAEPGPMGSLDFIRPEAMFVTAALFRDPKVMLTDLKTRIGSTGFSDELEKFRAATGVDLLEDVAGPMGGEMAFAIDGPLLPQPSWKLVIEMYDRARFDQAIDRLVARAAEWEKERSATANEPARVFSVTEETLASGSARELLLGGTPVHYAYRDGYLVACPSRPLLEAALQAHGAGSLAESAKLAALLPAGSDHVSLLAYEDLGSALGELAHAIPAGDSLPAELRALATTGPMLVHARASERAITLGLGSPRNGAGGQLASLVRQAMVQSLARRAALGSVGYDGAPSAPAPPEPPAGH